MQYIYSSNILLNIILLLFKKQKKIISLKLKISINSLIKNTIFFFYFCCYLFDCLFNCILSLSFVLFEFTFTRNCMYFLWWVTLYSDHWISITQSQVQFYIHDTLINSRYSTNEAKLTDFPFSSCDFT